jgi:hypothetical protein
MLILILKIKFILNLSFSKVKICENKVFRVTNFISIAKINLIHNKLNFHNKK